MEALFHGLSINTIKPRITFLKSIGVIDPKDYSSLQNIDEITNMIKTKTVTTQKSYIMHIITFLGKVNDLPLRQTYYDKFKESLKEARIIANNGSTKKSDSYINLKDLQRVLNDNKPKLITIDKFKKINDGCQIFELTKLRNYILMQLYIDNPALRNDYANVEIVTDKSKINFINNQLLITQREIIFYLNQYKSLGAFGQQEIKFTDKTNKSIRLLFKLVNIAYGSCVWLIANYKKKQYDAINETNLSAIISNISRSYFNKPWTSNDYRHMWENMIQGNPNYMKISCNEREKMHAQLLHNMNAALRYKIAE